MIHKTAWVLGPGRGGRIHGGSFGTIGKGGGGPLAEDPSEGAAVESALGTHPSHVRTYVGISEAIQGHINGYMRLRMKHTQAISTGKHPRLIGGESLQDKR